MRWGRTLKVEISFLWLKRECDLQIGHDFYYRSTQFYCLCAWSTCSFVLHRKTSGLMDLMAKTGEMYKQNTLLPRSLKGFSKFLKASFSRPVFKLWHHWTRKIVQPNSVTNSALWFVKSGKKNAWKNVSPHSKNIFFLKENLVEKKKRILGFEALFYADGLSTHFSRTCVNLCVMRERKKEELSPQYFKKGWWLFTPSALHIFFLFPMCTFSPLDPFVLNLENYKGKEKDVEISGEVWHFERVTESRPSINLQYMETVEWSRFPSCSCPCFFSWNKKPQRFFLSFHIGRAVNLCLKWILGKFWFTDFFFYRIMDWHPLLSV